MFPFPTDPMPTAPSFCPGPIIRLSSARHALAAGADPTRRTRPRPRQALLLAGRPSSQSDHRLYAYLTDEIGSENYRLRLRDLGSGRDLPDVITDVSSFAWSKDSGTLFYVKLDHNHRQRLVYRHRLGTDPAHDPLIYEETDLGFDVSVDSTRTNRFVVISTSNGDTSEERLIDSAQPESTPVLVAPRQPKVRYHLDDWADSLVIRTNADGAGGRDRHRPGIGAGPGELARSGAA